MFSTRKTITKLLELWIIRKILEKGIFMNVGVIFLIVGIFAGFSSQANSSTVGSITICPCNDTKGCGDFARECCSGILRLCCSKSLDPEREPIAPLAKPKEKLEGVKPAPNPEAIYAPPVAAHVTRGHVGHTFGDVEGGVDLDVGIQAKQVGDSHIGHTFGSIKGGLRGSFPIKTS